MMENEVEKCYCEAGFEKGAIKKNCEFENFSIFGNLMKKNTIVIRYYGCLKELNVEKDNNINLYYVFNNDWTNKKEITLTPCHHDKGSYCATIDLEDNLCITFGFYTQSGCYDYNLRDSYSLKIADNTIDNILKRYNMEENTELPITNEQVKDINFITSIFTRIKNKLAKLFKNVA